MGLRKIILFGIGHGFRIVDLLALVTLGMAGRGLKGVVDCLVSDLQKEGFALLGRRAYFLEPVNRLVGQKVGVVSLEGFSFAVDVEGRVEIGSLTGETDPVVEALAGSIVLMAHMPFADVAGAVSSILKVFGKKTSAFRNRSLVVHHAMMSHVLSG